MSINLSRLSDTSDALARAEIERARLIRARDAEIVAALAAGATWAEVRRASGLSLRGVQLAIERHRASLESANPRSPSLAQREDAGGSSADPKGVNQPAGMRDTTG